MSYFVSLPGDSRKRELSNFEKQSEFRSEAVLWEVKFVFAGARTGKRTMLQTECNVVPGFKERRKLIPRGEKARGGNTLGMSKIPFLFVGSSSVVWTV